MNKTNNAIQDTSQEDNKKLMDIIVNNQIAQHNELQRVNQLCKEIISSPEYLNNRLNIEKRKELNKLIKSSVNTTLSAQEIINNCEELS